MGLTLTGDGFIAPVSVIMGSQTISPNLITSTMIKIIIPTLPSGIYNVLIKNGDGTRWLSMSAFSVNQNSYTSPLVGSVAVPIVLPQRIIDNMPSATQNNNMRVLAYTSPANVTVDTETQTAVGHRPVNSAYNSSENQVSVSTGISESSGAIISSPWGNFTND